MEDGAASGGPAERDGVPLWGVVHSGRIHFDQPDPTEPGGGEVLQQAAKEILSGGGSGFLAIIIAILFGQAVPMANTLPSLIVRDAFGNQREVEIVRTPFTMGRDSDSDLVLLDSRVSRRHARIIQTEEGFLIEDLGSRHGTAVNNEPINSCLLKSGDRINLGVADSCTLSFVVDRAVLPELLNSHGQRPDFCPPRRRE